MLTARTASVRSGFTIIELLIALTVAGAVLSLLTLAGLRQGRLLAELFDDASLADQLRESAALLPVDLRALSAAAGDVHDARDTALETRSTIASGVVCDTAGHTLVLASPANTADTYASYATSIQAGDTVWLYARGDSSRDWRPYRITAVAGAPAGPCGLTGPTLSPEVAARARLALSIDSAVQAFAVIGRPLRITRRVRYSLYRSSDGSWNLGERDWNPSTQRFNTIQPIAGPFLSASSLGLALSYMDSSGASMPSPLTNARALAAITFTIRGETRRAVQVLGPAQQQGRRTDSVSISVLVHNRR